MGTAITRESFSREEYQKFAQKLRVDLKALKQLLADPDFGVGEPSIGAELEFYLVDNQGRTLPVNEVIAKEANDPQLQVELNRYNLEYNYSKQSLKGCGLKKLEAEIKASWKMLNKLLKPHNGIAVPIGILPTLKQSDFGEDAMTDLPRYRVLSATLRKMRGGPFDINIQGEGQVKLLAEEMTMEGANTSVQYHWRIEPKDFVNCHNAIQMISPILVALSANSPSFLGQFLWDETRICLFKQSVDYRPKPNGHWVQPARVGFGNGWGRLDPVEFFASNVTQFSPIIPICSDEDPLKEIKQGRIPELSELKLHQGTTWHWNRAVYDHHSGGHLRIELRTMPAGPTVIDMMANFAYAIGVAWALKDEMNDLLPALPFEYAEYNFYQAAQKGIEAKLIWPSTRQNTLKDKPLLKVASSLLPKAAIGLKALGVDESEIERLLGVIQTRIENRQTGATWQKSVVKNMKNQYTTDEAFARMLKRYIQLQKTDKPVGEWSIEV